MAPSTRSTFLWAISCALALMLPLHLAAATEAPTKLKFVLNWKYQGPQGIFFLPTIAGISNPRVSTSPSIRATAQALPSGWSQMGPMMSASEISTP